MSSRLPNDTLDIPCIHNCCVGYYMFHSRHFMTCNGACLWANKTKRLKRRLQNIIQLETKHTSSFRTLQFPASSCAQFTHTYYRKSRIGKMPTIHHRLRAPLLPSVYDGEAFVTNIVQYCWIVYLSSCCSRWSTVPPSEHIHCGAAKVLKTSDPGGRRPL